MATQKKKSSAKDPAAGQGRTRNTEPRVQVFTKFGGCNFQLSPRDFNYVFERKPYEDPTPQSDLQMNYVVVQNNARIAPNQTIETRQNITKLFDAPEDTRFTDVATLIDDELYIAVRSETPDLDKQILYGDLGGELTGTVEVHDIDDEPRDNTWTFLSYADNKLVGMTKGLQLWTGDVGTHRLENTRLIPTPPALTLSQLTPQGGLTVSASLNADHPFRISLRYTHLNKFGPTLASAPLVFYASRPTVEWSGSAFLTINSTAPTGYAIVAIELYYTEDEYQDPAFLARVDVPPSTAGVRDGGPWVFNWTGYLFDTSNWTIANLTAPTENYTSGVPASKMVCHDGRIYFWGGESPERLWIGGNPGNVFSVSTGVGGGFADCEPGTGQSIKVVPKFKTQQGASIVTILCDNPNSTKENRFNLVENNITLSTEQSAKGWQTEKISGAVGCKSFYGGLVCADGLYTVSRYGLALTTLTMEYNSQIRVAHVSDNIEPVFLQQYGTQLSESALLSVADVLYMTFGSPDGDLDNVIFCYDINLKTWWTYTLDIDEPILNMINIDHERSREGIGIITPNSVYLLPTTRYEQHDILPTHEVHIETAELSTTQPLQNMSHLSQLEFRFDYFFGEAEIDVVMIDQFGRTIHSLKKIKHDKVQHNLSEYIRVGQVVESYKIIIRGKANFRLTHFISKNYPKSNRIGMVWGFDSRQSHSSEGSIHRYFKSYNDLKNAIIP